MTNATQTQSNLAKPHFINSPRDIETLVRSANRQIFLIFKLLNVGGTPSHTDNTVKILASCTYDLRSASLHTVQYLEYIVNLSNYIPKLEKRIADLENQSKSQSKQIADLEKVAVNVLAKDKDLNNAVNAAAGDAIRILRR